MLLDVIPARVGDENSKRKNILLCNTCNTLFTKNTVLHLPSNLKVIFMKTICLLNHKGGVGKTTSVACIGAGLALRGKRVLVIDLDPQTNLTESMGVKNHPLSIYDAMSSGKSLPIVAVKENLSVVPSALNLAGLELEIAARMSRETILRRLIEPLKSQFDYAVIDCPPSLGLLTINGLVAADEVLIPLEAEFLAYRGIDTIVGIIETVRTHFNQKLYISGVFLTKYNRQRILTKSIREEVAQYFGDVLFVNNVRVNVALAEAPANGQDIFTYAPESNGAEDYLAIVDELLRRHI
jgi:chromosome partitioning protein